MLNGDRLMVYGGTGNHAFDASVLRLVNSVTKHDLRFDHCWHSTWFDGEPGFRIGNPNLIQGRYILIFSCPVTQKLVNELHDLVTAAKKQYGAKYVVVILSFMCYRRQDNQTVAHEITRLRWFISDLKHWGADELVVCEPHSVEHTAEYCREFGLGFRFADPSRLFGEVIRDTVQTLGGSEQVKVYSPDFGSIGRALALAQFLGLQMVATPKRRINTRVEMVTADDFMSAVREKFGEEAPISCCLENLAGRHVLMREDELDSGTTAVTTAVVLHKAGIKSVSLVATHPVCSRGWKTRLFPYGTPPPFQQIWLGNTRPRGDGETDYEGSTGGHVVTMNIAPCVASALAETISALSD